MCSVHCKWRHQNGWSHEKSQCHLGMRYTQVAEVDKKYGYFNVLVADSPPYDTSKAKANSCQSRGIEYVFVASYQHQNATLCEEISHNPH